ncbi:hypothetical protein SRHO_G00311380 [Serrasalmus rhombeus]
MVEWWARSTLGRRAHPLEMSALTLWMVAGWKSLRGSRVETIILALGDDSAALSATLHTSPPTLSCSSLRSLVPVWIMMYLGVPRLVLTGKRQDLVVGGVGVKV